MKAKIRLGISACLLGRRVRYDGGHKLDRPLLRALLRALGRRVDFVPVCPEFECGLPVPRECMHLAGDARSPRLLTVRTGADHTARMKRWAARKVRELEREHLSGFILKSRSPSCGVRRVPVHDAAGVRTGSRAGVWADALRERFPDMPVEDERRLRDPRVRARFLARARAYARTAGPRVTTSPARRGTSARRRPARSRRR